MFCYAQHAFCRGVDAHGCKRLELIEQIAGKNIDLAALDDPFDEIMDCLNMPLGLAIQIILAAVANADFRPKMLEQAHKLKAGSFRNFHLNPH